MLCFVPAQGMSVGWLKDVSEGAGGGGTEFHMLPLADERRTEECWATESRSGSPERNERNNYKVRNE